MPVTHTLREVVPLFPRLRIMAVSMERLEIGQARIAAVSIDMIHLNPVPINNPGAGGEEEHVTSGATTTSVRLLGRSAILALR